MFRRLGQAIVRFRVAILAATAVLAVAAAVLSAGVFDRLSTGGFENPADESERARTMLRDDFDAGTPNFVLLVTPASGGVTDPAVAAAGMDMTNRLASEPGVTDVYSFWSMGNAPPLASRDGDHALVVARIEGDEDAVHDRVSELQAAFHSDDPALQVRVGGLGEIYREMNEQTEKDLQMSELVTLPIVIILLIAVFGGLVAAGLPLSVGLLSIVGTLFVLWAISLVTQVSVFSINLTTALGLGLAIDYSLFVVSRFREELAAGHGPHEAVVRTVDTAGRTVVFSALTVAISLSALLLFPLPFLRSFAYAGIPVVLLSATGAVVSLGAGLAVLGRRVDALTLFRRRERPEGTGLWHRIATAVMRHPLPYAAAIVALLLVLGIPFLRIKLGLADDRTMSAEHEARVVHDTLRGSFDTNETAAFSVVLPGAADQGAIAAYAAELSRIEHVGRVDSSAGIYMKGMRVVAPDQFATRQIGPAGAYVVAVPEVDAYSHEGEDVLGAIRGTAAPVPVLVGGMTAQLVDMRESLGATLPWALGFIAVVTFVLLFLMTGSVLVPLKALVLNLLSLSATFGAMVWIFQDGHLSGLLGFTPTGDVELAIPVLMFCIAFGLSMDYEVFLLSRIKEEHDAGASNTDSVARGLEKTGRIVTAAAVLLAVVFLGVAASEVTFMKLFGLGLALAVIIDATLVRAILVPAFMRLAGNANWWAPKPLKRIYDRFGIHESSAHDSPDADSSGNSQEPRVPTGVR